MDAAVIPPDHPAATGRLAAQLETALAGAGAGGRPVAFACIGTDRSTGDALGPLVGQRLLGLGVSDAQVLGTLERPLHALNLVERLRPLCQLTPAPILIAVDAALGPLASVGTIHLRRGGVRPGEAIGKEMPEVGDISITATVNVRAGALDAEVLQSTRLWLVQGLADTIAVAAFWALRNVRPSTPALEACAA